MATRRKAANMPDREVHPVAALFPMIDRAGLDEMAADIRERGLLQPVVLDKDGRVLDGRNRLAACEIAGVEPEFTTYEGDDPAGYALAVNIERRHMTVGARAIVAEQARRLTGKTELYRTPRSKIAETTNLSSNGSSTEVRMRDAGDVLDWAPDRIPGILDNTDHLSTAVAEARERKKADAEREAKKDRLRKAAPDLLTLVEDQKLSIDEGVAACDRREQEAEEQRAIKEQEAEERRTARQRERRAAANERATAIDIAQGKAVDIVTGFQSDVAAIIAGTRLLIEDGRAGLIAPHMITAIREALDLLEQEINQ